MDRSPDTSAAAVVLALRPHSSQRYRRDWRRESLRDRFWVVPTLLMVLAALLAVGTAEGTRVGWFDSWPRGLRVNPASSQNILALVATSTLTFVGVVFTITLVALQLASAQLSPRVIRTFVRSGVTRLTFGMFLGTFTFSVVVLVLEGSLKDDAAESRAVTAAIFLVMASLIVFIFYVTATMKLLQVNWVLTAVADETRKAIRATFPPRTSYHDVGAPRLVSAPVPVALETEVNRTRSIGVILSFDYGRLVEIAQRHDCVVQIVHGVGEYLPTGEPAFLIHGGSVPSAAELAGCLHLGRTRTLHQDPLFGIRQLVDVAIQALSPALNQPTTAVHTIDRLEDLHLRMAAQPAHTGLWTGTDSAVRLIEPVITWSYLIDLSFEEITQYGADSVQVIRRLLACYDLLISRVGDELAAPLRARRTELTARQHIHAGALQLASTPDRHGLG